MSTQFIQMNVEFNAPVEKVFAILSDHEAMGKTLGANIKRVQDGEGNVNGVGSVRKLTLLPFVSFEETVTAFEQNRLVEYTVTKGSPLKNHLGRMVFSEADGKTHLHYTIQFDPKLPIPLSGLLLKTILEKAILTGLHKLAKQYR